MSFDGLLLHRALAQLAAEAVGARVERVHQPEERLVWLHLYRPERGPLALVACCAPRLARLHLSGAAFTNPPQPPVFCMVLRKHLLGARLQEVSQWDRDRVAELRFARRDGPGVRLVVELTGSRANLVLVDADGRVLDALRRVSEPAGRALHPGAAYAPPPPRPVPEDPAALLAAAARDGVPAWRALVRAVPGPGPDAARELCLAAGLDPDAPPPPTAAAALAEAAAAAVAGVEAGEVSPSAVWRDGVPLAVAAFPLPHLAARLRGTLVTYRDAAELADAVYGVLAARERERALRDALGQALRRARDRAERRLAARLEDLAAAEDPERLRVQAELLLAHLHQVPRGARSVRVPNLYDPDAGELEIPLDPALSPAENARRLFARYQRARRAAETAQAMVAEAREELAYLDSLDFALEQARDLADLEALREEMAAAGLLRAEPAPRPAAGDRGPEAGASGPLRLRSSDGWLILVGRNNRENDRLSLRLAAPDDLWLHAQGVAGAHVVCRAPDGRPTEPPPRTLEEAAMLAAYFSRARQGSNVPVDVTRCRHVRKPRGARPGMVVYDHHRTVYVTPDPERVRALLAGAGPASG